MIRFRPLPIMTVFAIAAFAVLMLLGRWQWERYETKRALAAEPVAEMTVSSYQPIDGAIQFVFGVRGDTHEQGWRVFAPVQYGDSVVFIDADFIPGSDPPDPEEVRFPASLRSGAPIVGYSIRPEGRGLFTPPPRPLQRLWFAADLAAMGRNAGIDAVADYYIASAYIGTDGRAVANPFARAPGADPLPPERHMGYAFTWFGLGIVLIVTYFAYHVSVGRLGWRAPMQGKE